MSTQQNLFEIDQKALLPKVIARVMPEASKPEVEAEEPDIGNEITQLLFDFEDSPSVMDAISAEAVSEIPYAFEIQNPTTTEPQANEKDDYSIVNSAYIELAINLMLTCAEDLVSADKVLNSAPGSKSPETLAAAHKVIAQTKAWLFDDLSLLGEDARDKDGNVLVFHFTFQDCAALLEEELRIQSMDQILIPNIGKRSDEVAEWIVNDSAKAKYIFSHYKRIFNSRDDMHLFDDSEDENENTQSVRRQRYGS